MDKEEKVIMVEVATDKDWCVRIQEDGFHLNRDAFKDWKPDQFAEEFINTLTKICTEAVQNYYSEVRRGDMAIITESDKESVIKFDGLTIINNSDTKVYIEYNNSRSIITLTNKEETND